MRRFSAVDEKLLFDIREDSFKQAGDQPSLLSQQFLFYLHFTQKLPLIFISLLINLQIILLK